MTKTCAIYFFSLFSQHNMMTVLYWTIIIIECNNIIHGQMECKHTNTEKWQWINKTCSAIYYLYLVFHSLQKMVWQRICLAMLTCSKYLNTIKVNLKSVSLSEVGTGNMLKLYFCFWSTHESPFRHLCVFVWILNKYDFINIINNMFNVDPLDGVIH